MDLGILTLLTLRNSGQWTTITHICVCETVLRKITSRAYIFSGGDKVRLVFNFIDCLVATS